MEGKYTLWLRVRIFSLSAIAPRARPQENAGVDAMDAEAPTTVGAFPDRLCRCTYLTGVLAIINDIMLEMWRCWRWQ